MRVRNSISEAQIKQKLTMRHGLVGLKPYLKDQLASFSALTLLVWSYDQMTHMTCKNRP